MGPSECCIYAVGWEVEWGVVEGRKGERKGEREIGKRGNKMKASEKKREEERDRETKRKGVPLGRAVSGTRVYVVSKRGKLRGRGGEGELWIGGEGVGEGYLGEKKKRETGFFSGVCLSPFWGRIERRKGGWEGGGVEIGGGSGRRRGEGRGGDVVIWGEGRRERLYKSGDVMMWGEDGLLYYIGRRDDQVKIRFYLILFYFY